MKGVGFEPNKFILRPEHSALDHSAILPHHVKAAAMRSTYVRVTAPGGMHWVPKYDAASTHVRVRAAGGMHWVPKYDAASRQDVEPHFNTSKH